jgi:hypothetical protein
MHRKLARNVFDEIIENNVFGLAAELAFYPGPGASFP